MLACDRLLKSGVENLIFVSQPTAYALPAAEPSADHDVPRRSAPRVPTILRILLALAALSIAGVLVWQGVTAGGNPDPTASNISPTAAVLNIAVLVFREGLE